MIEAILFPLRPGSGSYTLDEVEQSFLRSTYSNIHYGNPRSEGINETINFVFWAMKNIDHQYRYSQIINDLEEFGLIRLSKVFTNGGFKTFIALTEQGLESIDGKILVH